MGKFKLEIELGNDAMLEPAHVAEALRELIPTIQNIDPKERHKSGRIIDDNGNVCGTWTYENEPDEAEDDDG